MFELKSLEHSEKILSKEAMELLPSIRSLDNWLAINEWKGYDPFDGLNATFLTPLTFNNHYLRIILQQVNRRFLINMRTLLGIRKETSSKGMGFCALGYLKLYQATGNKIYLDRMEMCLEWLINNYSNGYSGYAWGNHFSYESRGGSILLGVPTIVWTSLIANVFLDAFEYIHNPKYFDVAKSVCNFIMNNIKYYEDEDQDICFMYIPGKSTKPSPSECIHNSNVLGASVLARLYQHTGDKQMLSLACRSINYTIKHQLSEGGWYYGEPKKYRWIDSFHTGYVLESIYKYIHATGDNNHEDKLAKGYGYFLNTFFGEDGTPRYYNTKTYPIDIQCASQGIQTLVNLRQYDERSLPTAKRVALWTIKHMRDPDGYFYFRRYPIGVNKTPMFHWGQSTMLSALAHIAAYI